MSQDVGSEKLVWISSFLIIAFVLCVLSIGGECLIKPTRIFLTIDLCPSSHQYESKLFTALDAYGHKVGHPTPVAICVSGKWLERHADELAKIKHYYLDITWVNHSYSHPIDNDFLNNPTVNFTAEVVGNIKVMEKYGLKPSKYFRFPGLRHNAERLKELKAMGYISLDADAWLGKEQPIKNGSIVLIHGNGNEVPGVVDHFIAGVDRLQWQLIALPLKD